MNSFELVSLEARELINISFPKWAFEWVSHTHRMLEFLAYHQIKTKQNQKQNQKQNYCDSFDRYNCYFVFCFTSSVLENLN